MELELGTVSSNAKIKQIEYSRAISGITQGGGMDLSKPTQTKCPFCAEMVLVTNFRCPFCDSPLQISQTGATQDSGERQGRRRKMQALFGISAAALVCYGAWYLINTKQTNASRSTHSIGQPPAVPSQTKEQPLPSGWQFYLSNTGGYELVNKNLPYNNDPNVAHMGCQGVAAKNTNPPSVESISWFDTVSWKYLGSLCHPVEPSEVPYVWRMALESAMKRHISANQSIKTRMLATASTLSSKQGNQKPPACKKSESNERPSTIATKPIAPSVKANAVEPAIVHPTLVTPAIGEATKPTTSREEAANQAIISSTRKAETPAKLAKPSKTTTTIPLTQTVPGIAIKRVAPKPNDSTARRDIRSIKVAMIEPVIRVKPVRANQKLPSEKLRDPARGLDFSLTRMGLKKQQQKKNKNSEQKTGQNGSSRARVEVKSIKNTKQNLKRELEHPTSKRSNLNQQQKEGEQTTKEVHKEEPQLSDEMTVPPVTERREVIAPPQPAHPDTKAADLPQKAEPSPQKASSPKEEMYWDNVPDFRPLAYKQDVIRKILVASYKRPANLSYGGSTTVTLRFTIEKDGHPENIQIIEIVGGDETSAALAHGIIEAAGPFRPLISNAIESVEVRIKFTKRLKDQNLRAHDLEISALGNRI
ncbi:MAG: hypothetical protein IPM93_09205 [Candidatus Obscuribacter sp.]|nr:hypothetical protein [Candidatus Obscuribacter sp.]